MPPHFYLARNSDNAQPLALAYRQPVAYAHLGTIEASLRPEAREARLGSTLHAAEECRERLVEAAEHLLLTREAVSGQPFVLRADRFQFRSLIAVAQRDAAPPVGFDALLKPGEEIDINPATGSSVSPGSVQPRTVQPSPAPAPMPMQRPVSQSAPRSPTVQTPGGAAVVNQGSGTSVQTYTDPKGGTGLMVPNGNGTSTMIAPDGSVQTVPTPK